MIPTRTPAVASEWVRAIRHCFSPPVSVFRDQRLPVTAAPAGYAALIDACGLNVPLPRTLSAIGERHRLVAQDGWRIYSPRYAPPPSLAGHLTLTRRGCCRR